MTIKFIGAALVILCTSSVGFAMAASYRAEEHGLQQLINGLEFMEGELSFRMPPLPEVCRLTAERCTGPIRKLFYHLASELYGQLTPDARQCMEAAMMRTPGLSDKLRKNLTYLSASLGRFDLSGQISGLRSTAELCKRDLLGLQAQKSERIRTYQTLGICAGVALVIIFI